MSHRYSIEYLMENHDMTWDEAQAELSRMAEDAYDREQDRRSEERYEEKDK